jgi:hypothetical protein
MKKKGDVDYLASASPPDLAADQWLLALSRHLSPASPSPSPKVPKSQVTRTPHAACEERLVYKEEVEPLKEMRCSLKVRGWTTQIKEDERCRSILPSGASIVDELRINLISPDFSSPAGSHWRPTFFPSNMDMKKGKQQRQEPAVPEEKMNPLIEEDLARFVTRTAPPP